MIVTKTTELGLQCVLYLAQRRRGDLVNPLEIAQQFGESATYIAKVLRQLAHSGIVRSHRGASGGFELARDPASITLLTVVEACQGAVKGNYCQETPPSRVPSMCGWHQAMWELKESCRSVLSRWTIARIMEKPYAKTPTPACRYRRVHIQVEPELV